MQGWNLQHSRKVEWWRPQCKTYVNGLSMGTFKGVHNAAVREAADQVFNYGSKLEPTEIPPPAKRISDEDLVERLIGNGLRAADAETVIQAIWRVRRLANWYQRHGRDLSEHEIRTFLVVPIVLALGWSEQKVKIEWKRTDMAFFSEPYKGGHQPQMILESKRMHEGLGYATRQAQRYAKEFPECDRLVVSDGLRYRRYMRTNGGWSFTAYMNLLNLKDRHPYLEEIAGAPDLCVSLMPG